MDNEFNPFGFQSGDFSNVVIENAQSSPSSPFQSELYNDDSYAGSMYYDSQHNVLFFTGSTYGIYFDSDAEMGVNGEGSGRDINNPHLDTSDCFLGVLKLPAPGTAAGPELIYARRFGTPRNLETCSSIIMLPQVNDALLQTTAQVKLALLGHVNPTPLTSADLAAAVGPSGGRRLGVTSQRQLQRQRALQSSNINRGGFLHSLLDNALTTENGRAYGFIADFDISLTLDDLPSDTSVKNAYGALLGGAVLDSSPLVYPTAMAQNKRDPNQIYVVSMHSDEGVVLNPEYTADYALEQEIDGILRERSDMTMGGAGLGSAVKLVRGGVPKYGVNFYVKVQQVTVTPYEKLMDVEPTSDEKVKLTMHTGWGFGFKLNDASDVRPSSVVFVKGRTPDEDLLLMGGTTRRDGVDGKPDDFDGFITKLIPPAPTPVEDLTTGSDLEGAIQNENIHPTQRIDSTTGRDETVTSICLPPPDPISGLVTHAYVVGSSASGHESSKAYIVKLRLDDLSIAWKEHVPSVHPAGLVGDVLGEGCAVSPDGTKVYLSGTIGGASVLDTRIMPNANAVMHPVGGTSDVFVIAYDVDFGNVHWAKQLGTVNEDKLARGGGIECDNEGNVIIMGSSRGGLQRYRPDEASARIPSDIFIMSLSGADGGYINAPYVDPVASTSGAPVAESSHKGLSAGAVAGISITVIIISCALLFLGLRRRASRSKSGDVLRSWNSGDDFTFGDQSLGSKRGSSYEKSPIGMLRIVRGANDDDWDDGSESVSRNATWMSQGGNKRGAEDDTGSVKSMGSNFSIQSFKSKRQDENFDFIASLRQEANSTLKKMMKDPPDSPDSMTSDPRLDGGASIKSLLSHYRDVKKETLFDDDKHEASKGAKVQGKRGQNNALKKDGEDLANKANRKGPPPPPPPRGKNLSSSVGSANGLSEFTIM